MLRQNQCLIIIQNPTGFAIYQPSDSSGGVRIVPKLPARTTVQSGGLAGRCLGTYCVEALLRVMEATDWGELSATASIKMDAFEKRNPKGLFYLVPKLSAKKTADRCLGTYCVEALLRIMEAAG